MGVRGAKGCVVLATLGALSCFVPAVAKANSLPDAYVGVWKNMEGRSESCRSSDWDGPSHVDTHIRLTPGAFEFHEGACQFTSVKTSDFGDAHVTMSCASEGETFASSEIWLLTTIRDHRMIVMTSRDREIGATIVYQHCP